MNRIALLGLLLSACSAAQAAPVACPDAPWTVERGSLSRTQGCDGYVAASDATDGAYTMGQFRAPAAVRVPFELTVRWRRLGAETRTLEIDLSGAVLLLGDGKVGLWTSDSHWEKDGGWREDAGIRLDELQTVRVRQYADHVEATLDGRALGRWPLAVGNAETVPAIAFKAPRGARGRVLLRSIALGPLQRQTSATSAARPK